MSRRATCQCGQLAIECDGDPVRVSACFCLDCQKRSGSSFAAQARFPVDRVTITGQSKQWRRTGEDGGGAVFDFCPTCGSQVFYSAIAQPEFVAVAVGAFADPDFPQPEYTVYENRKHAWVEIVGDGIEHDIK